MLLSEGGQVSSRVRGSSAYIVRLLQYYVNSGLIISSKFVLQNIWSKFRCGISFYLSLRVSTSLMIF